MSVRARTAKPAPTPAKFLADYPAPMRALAERLRRLVSETAPEATERVLPGWKALAFRDPEAGYFCAVLPFKDHVSLLFEHGVELEDPDGILTGDTKRVRWIPIRRPGEIKVRAFRAMILRALVHGATR